MSETLERIAAALEEQNRLLVELIAVQRRRPTYTGTSSAFDAPLAVQTDDGWRAVAWHELEAGPHRAGCKCDACGGERVS